MEKLMKIKSGMILGILLSIHFLNAQIYPAANGVFIIFEEHPDKTTKVKLMSGGNKMESFEWPSHVNSFIQQFRSAQTIFHTPTVLTDQDLEKIYSKLDSMSSLAMAYQYQPAMLIAMGKAVFLADAPTSQEYQVEILSDNKKSITNKLTLKDQRIAAANQTSLEKGKERGVHIDLTLTFPKDSWVDSARVYKKVLGSRDSVVVTPIIMTSQLPDRIEMHIRDTAQLVGEFLYTIIPHDRLGLWHQAIPNIYTENYNQLTAPRVTHLHSDVLKDSKYIRLAWRLTVPQRVRGFEIFRSHDHDGPFMKIATLPETDTVYVDHVEGTMQNFFYYIQVIDQEGKGSKSVTHFVTPLMKEKAIAPPTPMAKSKNGGIEIIWPTYDAFYNIRGYYVYRKGSTNDEWMQVSPFMAKQGEAMMYLDTSRELKAEKEYGYVVRSESTSYILSENSEIVWARPDKARIVSFPENLNSRFLDNGQLMLYWDDLKKQDLYVAQYHIFETDEKGSVLKEVTGSPIDLHQTTWTLPLKSKIAAGYVIHAEDIWGNKSVNSDVLHPIVKSSMATPGPVLVKPISTGYRLSWGKPDPLKVKSVQVFEQAEDGKSTLVKTLGNTVINYDIPVLKKDQVKAFYINYKMVDGQESEWSEVVVIRG